MYRFSKVVESPVITFCIAGIVTLIMGVFPVTSVAAEGSVTVTINSPDEVYQNSPFETTVEISEVSELNAVQYEILYDPSIISLETVDEGSMDSGDVIPLLYSEISPGQILVYQSMDSGNVSGTGTLSVITFQALQTGVCEISFSNGILSSAGGETIAAWVDDSVNIVPVDSGAPQLPPPPPPPDYPDDPEPEPPAEEPPDDPEPEPPTEEPLADPDPEPPVEEPPADPEPESPTEEPPADTELETNIEEPEMKQTDQPSESGDIDITNEENSEHQPVAEAEVVKWPILWGIIGGAGLLITLIVYAHLPGRRNY